MANKFLLFITIFQTSIYYWTQLQCTWLIFFDKCCLNMFLLPILRIDSKYFFHLQAKHTLLHESISAIVSKQSYNFPKSR